MQMARVPLHHCRLSVLCHIARRAWITCCCRLCSNQSTWHVLPHLCHALQGMPLPRCVRHVQHASHPPTCLEPSALLHLQAHPALQAHPLMRTS